MDLWAAVRDFLNDYYSACESIGIQEADSQKVFQDIIDKASRNVNFRKGLLNSPVKTLAKEGFTLPEGFGVKFVEETEDTILIPIPPYVGET